MSTSSDSSPSVASLPSGSSSTVTLSLEEYQALLAKASSTPAPSSSTPVSIVQLVNQIGALQQAKNSAKSTRYNLFPIQDEISYRFYKKQECAVWSANEMDFIRDRADFARLTPYQRQLLVSVLGFFSPGDGLISQNLVFRFLLECETYEEMSMFIAQLYIELVHSETYGLMTTTLIPDLAERETIFRMADHHPAMKAKADWVEAHIYADTHKADRFLGLACAEGIFFSVLFAIIFYFRSKGVMQTLTFANEQIAKDEGLHRDYGCYLYSKYKTDTHTPESALALIQSAVEVEEKFITAILPEPIDDLTADNLILYLHSIADNLLCTLGYSAHWGATNPFTWMNDISLTQKGNFYEVRIGNYKQFSLSDAVDWKKRTGQLEKEKDVFTDPSSIDF